MRSKSIAVVGIILFASVLTRLARAETRQVTWTAVTTYTTGAPIEEGATIEYTVYWSNDPWLPADTLRLLVDSTTALSATFDPTAEGMTDYQTIYFAVKTVLNTGQESVLSDTVAWNPPAPETTSALPLAPEGLGITEIATSTSGGMWEVSWAPVTKDTSGAPIASNSLRYTLYWTTDASLSPGSLATIASSIPGTACDFDPDAVGMKKNQRVFFTARAALSAGDESALSAALSWRVSNNGPGAPRNGRLTIKGKH